MTASLYIVIVGCGRLGGLLANQLSAKGHSVVVIDRDEAAFDVLSSEFSGFKIVGDAVEMAVLREANTEKADVLLAATRDDNVNVMVAQVAKTVFHVKFVTARVFEPSRETIYERFGVATISPTQLSAQAFLHAVEHEAKGVSL